MIAPFVFQTHHPQLSLSLSTTFHFPLQKIPMSFKLEALALIFLFSFLYEIKFESSPQATYEHIGSDSKAMVISSQYFVIFRLRIDVRLKLAVLLPYFQANNNLSLVEVKERIICSNFLKVSPLALILLFP